MKALVIYYHKFKWMDTRKEMKELIDALGHQIVFELTINKIHKYNYLTESKLEELKEIIEENEVDVIIFNEPVSIRYMQKLETLIDNDDIALIDKAMLILEIFEKRASSSEIKLQIKMAQIKYTEPRMRQELGVSLRTEKQARDRGTGETAKEIMQSDMRSRLSGMKQQLEKLSSKQQEYDETIPKIPILGYYSVGKSTIFNILTNSNRETGQEAFTTMFLKSKWSRLSGYPIELVDTIGLVDLPPTIIESFSLMLDRIFAGRLMIVCVDGTLETTAFNEQLDGLNSYYESFAVKDQDYKLLFIITKCDLINEEDYLEKERQIKESLRQDNFQCKSYWIMGSRSDRPNFVQNSFINILDEMLGSDLLLEFKLTDLHPSELSKVYDFARIKEEVWNQGTVNITGIIPRKSFDSNLSKLKDKLLK